MTRTETALAIFFTALQSKAESDPRLPKPTRNRALPELLDELPANGSPGARLNLVDGAGRITNVQLGVPRTYELAQDAEIEWLVQALEEDDRHAAFDAGLEAIAETVEELQAAIEAEVVTGLDDVEITGVERSNLAIDGVPQLKGAIISLRLQFVSPRPF